MNLKKLSWLKAFYFLFKKSLLGTINIQKYIIKLIQ